MPNKPRSRRKLVEFAKRELSAKSHPRLQISLILALTAISGLLASYSLLHAGISSMALRYPISIAIAYCFFLLLLRLWLLFQSSNSASNFDIPEPDISGMSEFSRVEPEVFSGGGDFSGGGSGGDWGANISSTAGDSSVLDGASLDLDVDEFWLVIVAVVALIGGLLAAFYVVYIAPVLLAEILVDGILIAGLYRRVRKIDERSWLLSAVRKTLVPAVVAALFFAVAGFAMQKIAPDSRSIGETWNHLLTDQADLEE